jgi:hypothetical protein
MNWFKRLFKKDRSIKCVIGYTIIKGTALDIKTDKIVTEERFLPSDGCDHKYCTQPQWINWECTKCGKKVQK